MKSGLSGNGRIAPLRVEMPIHWHRSSPSTTPKFFRLTLQFPFNPAVLRQIRSNPFPCRSDATRTVPIYGTGCDGVAKWRGSGASTPAMSKPATSDIAVRIIVKAVSIPATVLRSMSAVMLR